MKKKFILISFLLFIVMFSLSYISVYSLPGALPSGSTGGEEGKEVPLNPADMPYTGTVMEKMYAGLICHTPDEYARTIVDKGIIYADVPLAFEDYKEDGWEVIDTKSDFETFEGGGLSLDYDKFRQQDPFFYRFEGKCHLYALDNLYHYDVFYSADGKTPEKRFFRNRNCELNSVNCNMPCINTDYNLLSTCNEPESYINLGKLYSVNWDNEVDDCNNIGAHYLTFDDFPSNMDSDTMSEIYSAYTDYSEGVKKIACCGDDYIWIMNTVVNYETNKESRGEKPCLYGDNTLAVYDVRTGAYKCKPVVTNVQTESGESISSADIELGQVFLHTAYDNGLLQQTMGKKYAFDGKQEYTTDVGLWNSGNYPLYCHHQYTPEQGDKFQWMTVNEAGDLKEAEEADLAVQATENGLVVDVRLSDQSICEKYLGGTKTGQHCCGNKFDYTNKKYIKESFNDRMPVSVQKPEKYSCVLGQGLKDGETKLFLENPASLTDLQGGQYISSDGSIMPYDDYIKKSCKKGYPYYDSIERQEFGINYRLNYTSDNGELFYANTVEYGCSETPLPHLLSIKGELYKCGPIELTATDYYSPDPTKPLPLIKEDKTVDACKFIDIAQDVGNEDSTPETETPSEETILKKAVCTYDMPLKTQDIEFTTINMPRFTWVVFNPNIESSAAKRLGYDSNYKPDEIKAVAVPEEWKNIEGWDEDSYQTECCFSGSCWNGEKCVEEYNITFKTINNEIKAYGCYNSSWIGPLTPDYDWHYTDIDIEERNPDNYCILPYSCSCSAEDAGGLCKGNVFSKKDDTTECTNVTGFYALDHYCEPTYDKDEITINGSRWTSRTKLLAYQMIDLAGDKDFTLFCDEISPIFNYEAQPLNFFLDSAYTKYAVQLKNSFCTLEVVDENDANNNNVVLGIALNNEQMPPAEEEEMGEVLEGEGDSEEEAEEEPEDSAKQFDFDPSKILAGVQQGTGMSGGILSNIFLFASDTTSCPAAKDSDAASRFGKYVQCGSNKVWYNRKFNTLIYSKKDIAPQEISIEKYKKYEEDFELWKLSIVNFGEYLGLNNKNNMLLDFSMAKKISDYNRLYLRKEGGTKLFGITEFKYNPAMEQNNFLQIAVINDTDADKLTAICNIINDNSKTTQIFCAKRPRIPGLIYLYTYAYNAYNKEGFDSTRDEFVEVLPSSSYKYWRDMTSKLRHIS